MSRTSGFGVLLWGSMAWRYASCQGVTTFSIECHYAMLHFSLLCSVSLCWMPFCWLSWRPFKELSLCFSIIYFHPSLIFASIAFMPHLQRSWWSGNVSTVTDNRIVWYLIFGITNVWSIIDDMIQYHFSIIMTLYWWFFQSGIGNTDTGNLETNFDA